MENKITLNDFKTLVKKVFAAQKFTEIPLKDTNKPPLLIDGEIKVGSIVNTTDDKGDTIPVNADTYELANGKVLVVKDGGVIDSISDSKDGGEQSPSDSVNPQDAASQNNPKDQNEKENVSNHDPSQMDYKKMAKDMEDMKKTVDELMTIMSEYMKKAKDSTTDMKKELSALKEEFSANDSIEAKLNKFKVAAESDSLSEQDFSDDDSSADKILKMSRKLRKGNNLPGNRIDSAGMASISKLSNSFK